MLRAGRHTLRRCAGASRQRAASSSASASSDADVPTVPLLIHGERVASAATAFVDVRNPATGRLLCRTPLATPDELRAALDSSVAAARAWRDVPVTVRSCCVCADSGRTRRRHAHPNGVATRDPFTSVTLALLPPSPRRRARA
jgi:hypothetical protein